MSKELKAKNEVLQTISRRQKQLEKIEKKTHVFPRPMSGSGISRDVQSDADRNPYRRATKQPAKRYERKVNEEEV